MELRVLEYFLSIAREENFTKAAKQLHITQPTLSRQIADLEKELGVKLFTRSNHNIILTDDGLLLKRRAKEMISMAEKTKRDFLQKDDNLLGNIVIGSGEFLSTKILGDLISNFKKKYPLVKYELYSGNSENVKEGLENGILDIGLMPEPIDIHKYEFISMPVKEKWGALVSEKSLLYNKKKLKPKDLLNITLISAGGTMAKSNVGKWFGSYLNQIKVIAKGNLLYNEAILTQCNIAEAVLCIKLSNNYDGLKFIPFEPKLETTTALVWKREQVFSNTVSAFLDFAKKYIKSISDDYL